MENLSNIVFAMSEEKSRFRIKKDNIEIEFEGKPSDVAARYEEAFEWIKTVTVTVPKHKVSKEKKKKEEEKKPTVRTKGVATEVGKLIKEGWLDDYKRNTEVLKELERRAIAGVYIQAVDSALRKRVGKTLERKKDDKDRWVYRRMKETS